MISSPIDPFDTEFFRLEEKHLDELLELERQCFSYAWTAKQYLLAFHQKIFSVFGLRNSTGLLAYISFYHAQGEMEILNIAVRPELRRRGLAKRLMGLVLQIGQKMGIDYAVLEVRRSNEAARMLYAGFGFTVAGERKAYYPDNGEDAVIMRCDLAASLTNRVSGDCSGRNAS